jgi:hypothetical protein
LGTGRTSILRVSVAPPGLALILWRFSGVPFGHPRLLTVAPPGAENLNKFNFIEFFKYLDEESKAEMAGATQRRLDNFSNEPLPERIFSMIRLVFTVGRSVPEGRLKIRG